MVKMTEQTESIFSTDWKKFGVLHCPRCNLKTSEAGLFHAHNCKPVVQVRSKASILYKKKSCVFSCSVCDSDVPEVNFQEHLQNHVSLKPYTCKYCKVACDSQTKFLHHCQAACLEEPTAAFQLNISPQTRELIAKAKLNHDQREYYMPLNLSFRSHLMPMTSSSFSKNATQLQSPSTISPSVLESSVLNARHGPSTTTFPVQHILDPLQQPNITQVIASSQAPVSKSAITCKRKSAVIHAQVNTLSVSTDNNVSSAVVKIYASSNAGQSSTKHDNYSSEFSNHLDLHNGVIYPPVMQHPNAFMPLVPPVVNSYVNDEPVVPSVAVMNSYVNTTPLVPPAAAVNSNVNTTPLVPPAAAVNSYVNTTQLVPPAAAVNSNVNTAPLVPPAAAVSSYVNTAILVPPAAEMNTNTNINGKSSHQMMSAQSYFSGPCSFGMNSPETSSWHRPDQTVLNVTEQHIPVSLQDSVSVQECVPSISNIAINQYSTSVVNSELQKEVSIVPFQTNKSLINQLNSWEISSSSFSSCPESRDLYIVKGYYLCLKCKMKWCSDYNLFFRHIWQYHSHKDNFSCCPDGFSLKCKHLKNVLRSLYRKSLDTMSDSVKQVIYNAVNGSFDNEAGSISLELVPSTCDVSVSSINTVSHLQSHDICSSESKDENKDFLFTQLSLSLGELKQEATKESLNASETSNAANTCDLTSVATAPITQIDNHSLVNISATDSLGTFPNMTASTDLKSYYQCGFQNCSYTCIRPVDLLYHSEEIHGTETHFPCIYCGFLGTSSSALLDHLGEHIGSDDAHIFSGSIIENNRCLHTIDAKDLNSIIGSFEEQLKHCDYTQLRFVCNVCLAEFSSVPEFKDHCVKFLLKVVSCKHCRSYFLDADSWQKHRSKEHPTAPRLYCINRKLLCDAIKQNNNFSVSNLPAQRARFKRFTSTDRQSHCLTTIIEHPEKQSHSIAAIMDQPVQQSTVSMMVEPPERITLSESTVNIQTVDSGTGAMVRPANEEDLSIVLVLPIPQPSTRSETPPHINETEETVAKELNNIVTMSCDESTTSEEDVLHIDDSHTMLDNNTSHASPGTTSSKTSIDSLVVSASESRVADTDSFSKGNSVKNEASMRRLSEICGDQQTDILLRPLYDIDGHMSICKQCKQKFTILKRLHSHLFHCIGKLGVVHCPYCSYQGENACFLVRHIKKEHPTDNSNLLIKLMVNISGLKQTLQSSTVNTDNFADLCAKFKPVSNVHIKSAKKQNVSFDVNIASESRMFSSEVDSSTENTTAQLRATEDASVRSKLSENVTAVLKPSEDITVTLRAAKLSNVKENKFSMEVGETDSVQCTKPQLTDPKQTLCESNETLVKNCRQVENDNIFKDSQFLNKVSEVPVKRKLISANEDTLTCIKKTKSDSSSCTLPTDNLININAPILTNHSCKDSGATSSPTSAKHPSSSINRYQCNKCPYNCKWEESTMVHHLKTEHSVLPCGYCVAVFFEKDDFHRHINFLHRGRKIKTRDIISLSEYFTLIDSNPHIERAVSSDKEPNESAFDQPECSVLQNTTLDGGPSITTKEYGKNMNVTSPKMPDKYIPAETKQDKKDLLSKEIYTSNSTSLVTKYTQNVRAYSSKNEKQNKTELLTKKINVCGSETEPIDNFSIQQPKISNNHNLVGLEKNPTDLLSKKRGLKRKNFVSLKEFPFKCIVCADYKKSIADIADHYRWLHPNKIVKFNDRRFHHVYSICGDVVAKKLGSPLPAAIHLCYYCRFRQETRAVVEKHTQVVHDKMELKVFSLNVFKPANREIMDCQNARDIVKKDDFPLEDLNKNNILQNDTPQIVTEKAVPLQQTITVEKCTTECEVEQNNLIETMTSKYFIPKDISGIFRAKSASTTYCCPVCNDRLSNQFAFRLHLGKHGWHKHTTVLISTAGLLICHFCGYVASSQIDLGEHTGKHMTERQYICSLCDFDSHTRPGIKKHIQMVHQDVENVQYINRNEKSKSTFLRPVLVNLEPKVTLVNCLDSRQRNHLRNLLLENGIKVLNVEGENVCANILQHRNNKYFEVKTIY
ncbi:serine-rich adhesin for platelets isoform X12 [Biomphalaria glabrata]|nr:serine-rich adhesin for platelets isoform X12 [Biomphalaria glabrata]